MRGEAHDWGPHKQGIRWVQCQTCECLLHEPEAKEPCTGDPGHVEAMRAERARELRKRMRRVAGLEANVLVGFRQPSSGAYGLWQILPPRWRR